MKELTDEQLKKASILDLTDDLDLMRKALDNELFDPELVKDWGDDGKRLSLYEYGLFINDKKFLDRLDVLFEKEISAFFNE